MCIYLQDVINKKYYIRVFLSLNIFKEKLKVVDATVIIGLQKQEITYCIYSLHMHIYIHNI